MALNIKDPETERLAAEVAALAGETGTRAIKVALSERRSRLVEGRGRQDRSERLRRFLRDDAWPQLPDAVSGSDARRAGGDPRVRTGGRMIVGSSAVIAILLRETGIVLATRLGIPGKSLLARFIQEAELTVIPFTDQHWAVAVDAYLRFGKGRHPAALNFGDCLTYAVSHVAGEPLLCIGDDFARTDLPLVLS